MRFDAPVRVDSVSQIRYLPFCYLCRRKFVKEDQVDGDHVPPRTAFNSRDKEPPLKLKTHVACDSALKVEDRKIGQLIALRRGEGLEFERDVAGAIIFSDPGRIKTPVTWTG